MRCGSKSLGQGQIYLFGIEVGYWNWNWRQQDRRVKIRWNLNEIQEKDFNEVRGNEFRSSFTAFLPNLWSLLGPILLKTNLKKSF